MQFKTIIGKAATALSLSLVCALPAHAAGVKDQGTWEYTLLGRDINRHAVAATDSSAIYLYDTKLGVTWLRDAYANPTANGNGTMTWSEATSWAANLSTSMGTLSNWRLPTMSQLDCNATNCGFNPAASSSEMASLFFDTLGNKARYTNASGSGAEQADWGLTNTGSFKNFFSYVFWLDSSYFSGYAWQFNTTYGNQSVSPIENLYLAMAVHPGDVLLAPVPEPETYMMLLLGLGAVGALSRRRARSLGSLPA